MAVVCPQYILNGTCPLGRHCRLLHRAEPARQRLSAPCRLFQAGQCSRGPECRFAHVIDSTSSVGDEQNGQHGAGEVPETAFAEGASGEEESVALREKPKRCRYYKIGRCRRGTNCKFSHDFEPRVVSRELGRDAAGQDQGPEDLTKPPSLADLPGDILACLAKFLDSSSLVRLARTARGPWTSLGHLFEDRAMSDWQSHYVLSLALVMSGRWIDGPDGAQPDLYYPSSHADVLADGMYWPFALQPGGSTDAHIPFLPLLPDSPSGSSSLASLRIDDRALRERKFPVRIRLYVERRSPKAFDSFSKEAKSGGWIVPDASLRAWIPAELRGGWGGRTVHAILPNQHFSARFELFSQEAAPPSKTDVRVSWLSVSREGAKRLWFSAQIREPPHEMGGVEEARCPCCGVQGHALVRCPTRASNPGQV